MKDSQPRSVVEPPAPVVYLAFWQDISLIDARMCVRVTGNPLQTLSRIRKIIADIDPDVPVTETMPLIDQVRGTYTNARVARTVLSFAAALGLLLSAMGLYGVIAYEVAGRTHEVGIRMALGAKPQRVVRLFLRQGLMIVLAGSLAGAILAFSTTRLLNGWLFGVGPSDPAIFALATVILFIVVLLASYIPARRAARLDPMFALRTE